MGKNGHYATVTAFAEPVEEARRTHLGRVRMSDRFERGANIFIDGKGGMDVSGLDLWPESCVRIPQDNLDEVARYWQPILERAETSRTSVQVMAEPFTGDEWHAYGPVLSLTFGSSSDRTFSLMWDGQLSLPEELDTAVIGTLELICSNSRRARKYLLRDLPEQVATRLDCSTG